MSLSHPSNPPSTPTESSTKPGPPLYTLNHRESDDKVTVTLIGTAGKEHGTATIESTTKTILFKKHSEDSEEFAKVVNGIIFYPNSPASVPNEGIPVEEWIKVYDRSRADDICEDETLYDRSSPTLSFRI